MFEDGGSSMQFLNTTVNHELFKNATRTHFSSNFHFNVIATDEVVA